MLISHRPRISCGRKPVVLRPAVGRSQAHQTVEDSFPKNHTIPRTRPKKATMQPVITVQNEEVSQIDYPHGSGRFLTMASQYLYTWLWDPFILTRTQEPPAMLFYAHPTPAEDHQALAEVLNAGWIFPCNRTAFHPLRRGVADRHRSAPQSQSLSPSGCLLRAGCVFQ